MAITVVRGVKGDRYRVTYRDADGKQQSGGTYGTRKQAEREYQRAKLRVDDNLPPRKAPTLLYAPMTLGDYEADWLKAHRLGAHAKATYSGILKSKLVPELGTTRLADIDVATVKALFMRMEAEGATNAYISKVKCVLSALMQAAAEDPKVPVVVNPVRGIHVGGTRPQRRKAISKEEFGRLVDEVPEHYRLLLRTIAGSGIRIEEATALTNDSLIVTDAGAWLNIVGTLVETKGREFTPKDSTKTHRDRMVKISPALAKDLAALPKGFMFLREDGLHIGLDSFRKIVWRPACRRAGIPASFTLRDLRRCHATWLRAGGADLEAVRDRLGHTSVATTDRYLAEDKSRGDSALDALGDLPG